jgi:FSR family fosmidomycin resistance protein-like MFS transporter
VFSFFWVLIIGSASYLIGPLIPIISKELNVGLDIIGIAVSISVVSKFIATMTTGNLIEIFGYKKVYFIGIVFSIFGIAGMYFASTYTIFLLAFFALALGIGVAHVATLSLVGNYYFKDKTNYLIKLALGNGIAVIVAPLLASLILFIDFDWKYIYIFLLIPQFVIFILLFFLKIPIAIKKDESVRSLFGVTKKILINPHFIICAVVLLVYSTVKDTFFTWFTSYFTFLDIEVSMSSLILAGYGITSFAGMIIKNALIRKFKERKVLMYGVVIAFIAITGMIFVDNIIIKIILIFIFGFGLSAIFTITFSLGLEVTKKYAGSVSGLLMAMAYPGVIVFQYISGYMLENISANSVLILDAVLVFLLLISVIILNFRKVFKTVQ